MDYPVFIHHEGYRYYLPYCLEQACNTNNNVIFLGDKENSSLSTLKNRKITFCDININIPNMRFDEFIQKYVHLTTYDVTWCKQFFRRLFYIEAYLKNNNIDGCFMLDSDILCYCNLSELPFVDGCDAAFCIPEQTYEELRWVANLGVSFFRRQAITEMIDFIIDEYTNNVEELKIKWKHHQLHKKPGGICEMSLAYLWAKKTGLRIENLCRLQGENEKWCINNSLTTGEGYYPNEYKINKFTGISKLRFVSKDNEVVPELYNHLEKQWVVAKTIHFHTAKLLIPNIQKKKRLQFTDIFRFWYLPLFAKLLPKRIKNIIKK